MDVCSLSIGALWPRVADKVQEIVLKLTSLTQVMILISLLITINCQWTKGDMHKYFPRNPGRTCNTITP